MVDTVRLRAVIDAEPANGARSDPEVLTWFQESVTAQHDITYQDLVVWASEEGVSRKLKLAIADEEATPGTLTAPVYNDTLTLELILKSGGELALSRDDVRAIVSGISGPGLPLSAPNRAALFAKSDVTDERWIIEGFAAISNANKLSHISEARAL